MTWHNEVLRMDLSVIQKTRISKAIGLLPVEVSGLFTMLDRRQDYLGNPDGGIPPMTYFTNRKRIPRGMLKTISGWFLGHDLMKESRPDWGEFYAIVRDVEGGEMRVSMKVTEEEEMVDRGIEIDVDVEIIHRLGDA